MSDDKREHIDLDWWGSADAVEHDDECSTAARSLLCVCGVVLDDDAMSKSERTKHVMMCEHLLAEYIATLPDLWYGNPPDYVALPCDDSQQMKRWRAAEHMSQCDECADVLMYYVESL